MEYDVSGQLLAIPLRSKGILKGNFSNISHIFVNFFNKNPFSANTKMYIKGNMKTVDQNGVKYFKLDKLFMKIRIGDGKVKLTAASPDLQFAGMENLINPIANAFGRGLSRFDRFCAH